MPGSVPDSDDDTTNILQVILSITDCQLELLFTLLNNKVQIQCVLNINSEIRDSE